jgi:hypothetical protein
VVCVLDAAAQRRHGSGGMKDGASSPHSFRLVPLRRGAERCGVQHPWQASGGLLGIEAVF